MDFLRPHIGTRSMPIKSGMSLEHLLRMLSQQHSDASTRELIRKYCLETTSDEMQKKGMEFLYIHGFLSDLEQLIEKNRTSADTSKQQWAVAYRLVIDSRKENIPPIDILRRARNIKTHEPELKCVVEFVKNTAYFRLNDYGSMGNFLHRLQQLFDQIDDRLIVSYFKIRLYQNLFIYYWMRNELIIARKYAFRALNKTPNPMTKVNIHINLGLTYTFDTFHQGMYHMSEALKLSQTHRYDDQIYRIKHRNIPFLAAVFKQTENMTTDDKSEQAHLAIARGDLPRARALLDEIPIDSPFRLYYLGLAQQNRDILTQAYNQFIEKRSDFFFSRLPLKALSKL